MYLDIDQIEHLEELAERLQELRDELDDLADEFKDLINEEDFETEDLKERSRDHLNNKKQKTGFPKPSKETEDYQKN